jgi:hypothetical protein
MTTSTLQNPPLEQAGDRAAGSVPVRPISLARVIHSEWIKLRTLRANWALLASFVAVFVGFGALAAAFVSGTVTSPNGGGPQMGSDSDPLSTVLTGAQFGVLLLGVMGCLAGAREYTSRMITATVAAVPRRWQVIVGKATVLTAVVLPASLLASFAAFGIGMSVLSASGEATVSLTDDGVLRSVVGMAGYLTAIALIGLAFGMLLRSVASSISALIAGILIVPNIAGALLPDTWDQLLQYLPSQAAASFTAVGSSGAATLGAAAGALVLAGWVIVPLAGAIISITRRDA